MQKYAIIDSGTNTFSINIYEVAKDGQFLLVFKKSIYVYLAEEGIDNISKAAAERALNAYRQFKIYIEEQQVAKVKAIGTAALRKAANGMQLVAEIKAETGIEIEIVEGLREATLIYEGVRMTLPDDGKNSLIIDIGGGSVEFILCNKKELYWAQSFEIGGALLYNKFVSAEPVRAVEIDSINDYLEATLEPLLLCVQKNEPARLVAASGTLDALAALLQLPRTKKGAYVEIEQDSFRTVFEALKTTTIEQRLAMPGMIQSRAKLLVVAMNLLSVVLKTTKIKAPLLMSDYALHEGALSELLQTAQEKID